MESLSGCYHYAEGGDYVAEANHFLDVVGNRVGEAILCLDWEGQDNPTFGKNDFDWVKKDSVIMYSLRLV